MSARPDELEPASTAFELGVELRDASHRLMRLATGHVVARRHGTAYGLIADSITLDVIIARLDDGNVTHELARLFLDAARTLIDRRVAELEATR